MSTSYDSHPVVLLGVGGWVDEQQDRKCLHAISERALSGMSVLGGQDTGEHEETPQGGDAKLHHHARARGTRKASRDGRNIRWNTEKLSGLRAVVPLHSPQRPAQTHRAAQSGVGLRQSKPARPCAFSTPQESA